MRIFLWALPAVMLVAGCSTHAQIEANRQRQVAEQARPELDACFNKVQNDPRYAAVFKKMETDGPNGLRALSDTTRPTKTETALLFQIYEDRQPCRKMLLEATGRSHPMWAAVFTEQHAVTDELWTRMANGQLTWGEFNQRSNEIRLATQQKLQQVNTAITSDLERQHYSEVAQAQVRSQALLAAGAAMAAGPPTVNCTSSPMGNSVHTSCR